MLGDNIKILRKQKGYSQETLAGQLNVVRQTISKWEKGISVPDAEMLNRMAEVFEVSVEELLGNKIPESTASEENSDVVKQLAILNEQLAIQNHTRKRTRKTVKIALLIALSAIASFIVIIIVGTAGAFLLYRFEPQSGSSSTTSVTLHCVLNDEEYVYDITYDEQYRIIETGGDTWVADHVQTEQYSDANTLIAQIEDYFTEHGGSCEVIEDAP